MCSDTRNNSPPRTNGWSCPWHPLQVFSLLFIFLLALSHYGFLVYYFPGYWRIIGYIVPGIILLITLVCIIITATIDPADTHLKHNVTMGIFKRGHFNPNEHAHVISEEYHCRLCNTDVTCKAKHCRVCDKCVEGFDHHCKWLNTCVGSKNYRWFIATIASGLFGSVSAVTISTVFFVLYFSSRDNIRYYCNNSFNVSSCDDTIRIFAVSVPAVLFPIVTGILIILNGIATILVGHLTIFHCYLIIKGISTYDYITMQRQDTTTTTTTTTTRACCLKKNINRVSPTAEVDNISLTDSAGMITFNRTPPDSDNETQLQNTIELLPLPNYTNQDIDITNNVQSSSQQYLEEVQSNHSLSNHSTTNNDTLLILPIEHPPSPVSPSPVSPSPVFPSPVSPSPVSPSPVRTSPIHTSPVLSSPVSPSPVPTSSIPMSPVLSPSVPTSPIPTSHVPTSPVLSPHVSPSPILASPVPPSPISTSPVPHSPVLTSQWSLSNTISQATIRKVTFNEIDKDKSVHQYLPSSPHVNSSLSRRPLPPLISDDPCHHWSYESLTSVNSSQSCISLSHDVRYQRHSLTKLPPLHPIETIGLKRNELKEQFPHNLTPLVKSNRQ